MRTIYTILVDNTNELKTTIPERIMCKNKLVDSLHFLVYPTYRNVDMSDFTVTIEYVLPISKEYHTATLVLSEEKYKDFLEYKIPIDTGITKEPGNVELQLTFTKVEMNELGEVKQYVRHTGQTILPIIPISAWSDMVPDNALSSLDQRLLKTDAMINQLKDIADVLDNTKADDIALEENKLTLLANGEEIGSTVDLTPVKHPGGETKIEVVEF